MSNIDIVDGTFGVKPSGFYVYIHRRLSDGLVMHVGKGNRRRAWSRSGRNKYWRNTSVKHGVLVEILKDGLSEQCALTIEKIAIFHYKSLGHPLTNLTYGGGGTTGWRHADEARVIISNHSKAQVRTKKQLAALRLNDGKPIRDFHKAKLSAAKIREKAPTFDQRNHEFRHDEHGIFRGKQYDFKENFGLPSDGVSRLIKGNIRSTKGWTYVGIFDIIQDAVMEVNE